MDTHVVRGKFIIIQDCKTGVILGESGNRFSERNGSKFHD